MRSLFLLLPIFMVGCVVGPKMVRSNYTDYNETINYNQNQQMLLNIVRLKYRELPLFLKVGALSTSYTFELRGGTDARKSGSVKAYGIDFGSSYATRPTITYTPLEGDTFVKQVLSEVDRDAFLLLFRSGWSIRLLCAVMVERIGLDINKPDDPTFPRFQALVDSLQEAQDNDKLDFEIDGDVITVVIRTDRASLYDEERLDETREIRLPVESVQLRSFLDILFSLGKNTEVPEEHLDQVRPSPGDGWIRIRSSARRPEDALVATRYNGYWFSIAESDVRSKDTFSLVKLVYQMQAGDIPTVQPLLTLPVAQP